MCGRFELPGSDRMAPYLSQFQGRYEAQEYRGEGTACPGETLPVLARGKSGKTGAFLMRWGYEPAGKGAWVINARSETAGERALFADSFSLRRCLIPARHYYEWQRLGGKDKPCFALTPQGAGQAYLAGLYRHEGAGRLPAFVVLTRPAEGDIAFIHHRMPVMLAGEAARAWLSPQADPKALLENALRTMDVRQVNRSPLPEGGRLEE